MSYTQQILQARELYENMDLSDERKDTARHFAFFSANLHQFLPHVPWSGHAALFRRMCLHQRLSHLDLSQPGAMDDLQLEGWDEGWASRIAARPGIICTFHTGSYRLLALLLARAGIRYAVVLSQATLHGEGEAFRAAYRHHTARGGELPLIDAEKPTSAFECYGALRRGYNLLLYPDGNMGSGTGAHVQKMPFLHHSLRVRTGPAHLAHALQYPLYRVLSSRTSLTDIRYQDMEVMTPNGGAETFICQAMERLYLPLADMLREDPAQWTCWPQAHFHVSGPRKLPEAIDEPGQWAIFTLDRQAYLFDKGTYLSYPIDRTMLKSYRGRLSLE